MPGWFSPTATYLPSTPQGNVLGFHLCLSFQFVITPQDENFERWNVVSLKCLPTAIKKLSSLSPERQSEQCKNWRCSHNSVSWDFYFLCFNFLWTTDRQQVQSLRAFFGGKKPKKTNRNLCGWGRIFRCTFTFLPIVLKGRKYVGGIVHFLQKHNWEECAAPTFVLGK